jgi:predicted enzyme related to lactoylglutathione lyase
MIQGQIVWFEIPVNDLDRAMFFYSKILSIKIEKNKFLDQEYGVFNTGKNAIRGVLVVKKIANPDSGIVLYFYVVDMSESLKDVLVLGGRILTEKTLIKQKTKEGNFSVSANLIDGNVGYYSEFVDCEGNSVCLYSNS